MTGFSTIIVSNRLPIKVSKINGKLSFSQSDGGLATAVSSIDIDNKIWVGWPGIDSDVLTSEDRAEIIIELEKHGCYPVFLTKEEIALFYEGYSNDTLWPLFHYFQSYMINRDSYWKAYNSVNRTYRDAVRKVATECSRIWVHDYQLMLLPAMIREKIPNALIGYFHHIPFPSYEVFRLLPERREILRGLLGADLIGFHIYDYARHFLSSCLRLLGIADDYGSVHIDGRLVRVDSFPIGIDYDKFVEVSHSEESQAHYDTLIDTYDGQKMIFSIDRLDYSKGIVERLEGYKRFLEDNPEYLGQVVLNMVVSPSRTGVDTYHNLQSQVEQLVSRINGEFGTSGWMPIYYQFQTISLDEIVPLYMAADTMLVTPRRDGMNLVAKEYVASKGDIPGVLILSEMAGAVDELPEALVVNPNDTLAIARAIKQSFTMSRKEKLERLAAMQRRVCDYPVSRWSTDFLVALDQVRQQQIDASILDLHGEQLDKMIDSFKKAKDKIILLDYDGTIQTFKSSPRTSAAAPSEELRNLLAKLSNTQNTQLCIVSGRSRKALDAWFGDLKVDLIAEHGAWVKSLGVWHDKGEDFEAARKAIEPVMVDYTSRTPGSMIEQKDFSSVWHYRNVSPDLALVRAYSLVHELNAALADNSIGVYAGNKIIEIKPTSISKETTIKSMFRENHADFILVAGDDYTDEDMFAVAPSHAYTIKVGPGDTLAKYRIAGVDAMVKVLRRLSGCK